MKVNMEQIGNLLVPSVAYGDAHALPTEGMSAIAISTAYGHINRLIEPSKNQNIQQGGYPAGTTSDDTRLTVALSEALIDADDFDIGTITERHLDVYREILDDSRKGGLMARLYGRSTIESLRRLDEGVPPTESGLLSGAGNGVVMKVMPLLFWQAARDVPRDERHRQYDQLTTMTHDSEIAQACTRLHGDIVFSLLAADDRLTTEVFRSIGLQHLSEQPLADPRGGIRQAFINPAQSYDQLVQRYASVHDNGKYGFYVPDTLAMVYDTLMASKGDYATVVTYATNLGGDADSVASIAGSMANIWSGGTFEKPVDFESVYQYERLAEVSRRLSAQALRFYEP